MASVPRVYGKHQTCARALTCAQKKGTVCARIRTHNARGGEGGRETAESDSVEWHDGRRCDLEGRGGCPGSSIRQQAVQAVEERKPNKRKGACISLKKKNGLTSQCRSLFRRPCSAADPPTSYSLHTPPPLADSLRVHVFRTYAQYSCHRGRQASRGRVGGGRTQCAKCEQGARTCMYPERQGYGR